MDTVSFRTALLAPVAIALFTLPPLSAQGAAMVRREPASTAAAPLRVTDNLAPQDPQRPRIGVTTGRVEDVVAEQLGVDSDEVFVVMSVVEGLPAARAGVKRNDIVRQIDGKSPASLERLQQALGRKKPGDVLRLGILRGGKEQEIEVRLDAAAAGVAPRAQGQGGAAGAPNTGFARAWREYAAQGAIPAEARAEVEKALAEAQKEIAKASAELAKELSVAQREAGEAMRKAREELKKELEKAGLDENVRRELIETAQRQLETARAQIAEVRPEVDKALAEVRERLQSATKKVQRNVTGHSRYLTVGPEGKIVEVPAPAAVAPVPGVPHLYATTPTPMPPAQSPSQRELEAKVQRIDERLGKIEKLLEELLARRDRRI